MSGGYVASCRWCGAASAMQDDAVPVADAPISHAGGCPLLPAPSRP